MPERGQTPDPPSLACLYFPKVRGGPHGPTSSDSPSYLRQLTKADPRDLAIISVKGDSMLPTLRDEDVVMVDASKRDLSWGGIFVIKVDGEALLVKRISLGSGRGMIKIVSDNPAFPGVERRSDEIEVIGRVIWYGAKL